MTKGVDTTQAEPTRKMRPLSAYIRVDHPEANPQSFALRSFSCCVGSAPENDIVIANRHVSRRHVEFELVPEGIAVRDLGSTNGTYHFGQRIERAILSFGTRLTLAKNVSLQVDLDLEALRDESAEAHGNYGSLIGVSESMRRLFGTLKRLEGCLVTVLLEGDSGTGKELIARALHDHSQVQDGPFIAVNCGAVDHALVRSELFGHRRGAFTGAFEAQLGAFEAAQGGTLFLDEIGELPKEVQPVLLRALETRTITRVGETKARPVQVRIIAATNSNLAEAVEAGRFRGDLYHRLAVVKLQIPALHDRPEDVEPLAWHWARSYGFEPSPQLLAELRARSWPGNVRELKNAIEAFAALGTLPSEVATGHAKGNVSNVAALVDTKKPYAELKEEFVRSFTESYLTALLAETGGNQSEAARRSGLQREYVCRLVAKLGIAK